jgi:hypothetical protein
MKLRGTLDHIAKCCGPRVVTFFRHVGTLYAQNTPATVTVGARWFERH